MRPESAIRITALVATLAAACAENPLPPREQAMAAANWRPRPPDRLRCTNGPYLRVMTHFIADVMDSAGTLACQVTNLFAPGWPRDPPPSEILLQVKAFPRTITLTTPGTRSIYFTVIAGAVVNDYDWAPCALPDDCLHVSPGESVKVRYEDILGWKPGDPDAVLYLWRLIPSRQGGFEPDRVRAVFLELRPYNPVDTW